MYSHIPFDLNQLLDIGVDQWLQICIVDTCKWVYVWSNWWFGQIHAGHGVLDCQCRHEFSDSNAWIALTYVPPKELHWPLCTGWRPGWYRKLPMPVSIQSCECCPVVVDWYLMLCHTQCNRSPAWSVQWPGTVSKVCLCPLPTSSEPPRGYGSEPPCIGSLAHWYAWVPPEPEELRWLLHRQKSVTNLDCRGSLNPRSWCSKMYDFTFVGCKFETIPCCPFLYCIYNERPRKQIARSSTNSVLKMSLANMSQWGHHQLEHLTLGRICQRVYSQFWPWFCGPWDIPIQKQAVCLWRQSYESLERCHLLFMSIWTQWCTDILLQNQPHHKVFNRHDESAR